MELPIRSKNFKILEGTHIVCPKCGALVHNSALELHKKFHEDTDAYTSSLLIFSALTREFSDKISAKIKGV